MSVARLYRPAWFLRMYVRLDDFGAGDDSDTQDGEFPYKEPQIQQQVDAAVLEGQIAAMTATGSRSRSAVVGLRALAAGLQRRAANMKIKSAAGSKGQGDEYSIEFITTPMELTITDKGFREADELEASFPFDDVPLFPWIVRELRIEGWVGTVSVADFATPERWHLEPKMSKTSVLRFNGYVDPLEMEHDDTSGTIHIKARSYIAVLIDGKINPHAKVYRIHGTEEYLTDYINRILSLYPPTAGGAKTGGDPFRAYWYASPANQEPKLSAKALSRSLQTAASRNAAAGQSSTSDVNAQADPPNEAADQAGMSDGPATGSPGIPPKSVTEDGMSIWDLITQACELCGVLPMYKPSLPATIGSQAGKPATVDPANCLLITPPEAFLDDVSSATQIAGGARDGFKRRFTDADGNDFGSDVRFMVWGHNIGKMKLSRHLGKVRPSAVEIRSYNPDASNTLRVLSARFPAHNPREKKGKGKSANKMTEKGGGKIDVIRTFTVKGVRDIHQLERIAVSTYHQLTRAELTMELETDELASYIDPVASLQTGGLVENHNDNPDILRLCAGTPVHVTVANRSTADSDLTICSLSDFYDVAGNNINDLLLRQNQRWGNFLTDGSLDLAKIADVAAKIQRAYRAAKLPTVYYCKSIRLKFGADDTFFRASMELGNYMPSNDPANLSSTDQDMNDQRKLKPTGAAAAKKSHQQAQTDGIAAKVGRRAAGGH